MKHNQAQQLSQVMDYYKDKHNENLILNQSFLNHSFNWCISHVSKNKVEFIITTPNLVNLEGKQMEFVISEMRVKL